MKKLLPVLALSLLFGLASIVKTEEVPDRAAPVQLTEEEIAACDRLVAKLSDKYEELAVHGLITQAFQQVADENREDFEVALRVRGVDLEDAEGNIVPALFMPLYVGMQ